MNGIVVHATVAFGMFSDGVDRLRMTSEKHFSGGKVIMEIDCDAANPDVDQYTITIADLHGRTIRRERYNRADVEGSAESLGFPPGSATTQPACTQPATTQSATTQRVTPEELQSRLASERRRNAVIAATQPARLER